MLHDLSEKAIVLKEINCAKGETKYVLDDLSLLSHTIYLVCAKSSDGILVKKMTKVHRYFCYPFLAGI